MKRVLPSDFPSTKRLRHSGPIDIFSLLDLTQQDSTNELCIAFDKIAKSMLHDQILCITTPKGETQYAILELEMYLKKEGIHEDPFTHASDEQRVAGNWYECIHFLRKTAMLLTLAGDDSAGAVRR